MRSGQYVESKRFINDLPSDGRYIDTYNLRVSRTNKTEKHVYERAGIGTSVVMACRLCLVPEMIVWHVPNTHTHTFGELTSDQKIIYVSLVWYDKHAQQAYGYD